MEFRPHKSKMYVIWKNDKIYCNTESIWTDKYWKQTNGCRFKMTDTQNVLFWLNFKFSAFFLNQNISPNSHIFMFSAIYLLFYWTGFVTDRKDIPLNRWIAPIQGIFFKITCQISNYIVLRIHICWKITNFHSQRLGKPFEFIFYKKWIFLEGNISSYDHTHSHVFSMKFSSFPSNCLVRNFQIYGRYSVEMFK